MKILILSATVGEGHDAAATAITEHLRSLDPNLVVERQKMAKVTGGLVEKSIVNVYKFQLIYAPWSYKMLYDSIVSSKRLTRTLKSLCGLVAGAKTQKLIEASAPDVVLSTYPLTSAMLEWLKIRKRITPPCMNLLTDFAPHPMWMFAGIDDNYVIHSATVPAVEQMVPGAPLTVVAPPIALRFFGPSARSEGRARLGIPKDAFVALIAGGGWGVGNLAETAETVASIEGITPVVLCGRNEKLRQDLIALKDSRLIVLGFVDYMPELLDAADVLVHNAGGLTSLEAFARGCPLIITKPIPGHGVANAKLMSKAGVARWAESDDQLREILLEARSGSMASQAHKLAENYRSLPSVAESLIEKAEQAQTG